MNNKVILGDNMEYMKTIPDNYFELAIVDPEYGISINNSIGRRKGDKASGHKKVTWDKNPPSDEYFIELFRISKNQIVWGANYFKQLWEEGCKGFCIWDKLFSNDVSFSACELAYTSFDTTSKIFKFSPQKEKGKIHPTQKPVALYKWLLKNYAKPNDKIFDSHVGSGSIRIACHDMGFDFTGREIDKDYYSDQEKRFKKHTQQGDLFGGEELQESIYHGDYVGVIL